VKALTSMVALLLAGQRHRVSFAAFSCGHRRFDPKTLRIELLSTPPEDPPA
jgi:hypothetical protein